MADDLFELRNYFYLGNLATAITEGETVSLHDPNALLERDIILARIKLAQGDYASVLSSIPSDDDTVSPSLQVVRLLALLSSSDPTATTVASTLATLCADDRSAASPCFLALAAIAYARLADFDNALRTAQRAPTRGPPAAALEARAVAIHVLLQMDRVDVARTQLATMQQLDEDATLTQLATASVHLATAATGTAGRTAGDSGGGPNTSSRNGDEGPGAQEALYIFQDLLERHGATDAILNGMAVCHLAMGRPDESERVLNEALAKNQNCSSSLVNVICTAKYRNKPVELVTRYFSQLDKIDPANSWLADYRAKETEFDQLAEQLAVTA